MVLLGGTQSSTGAFSARSDVRPAAGVSDFETLMVIEVSLAVAVGHYCRDFNWDFGSMLRLRAW